MASLNPQQTARSDQLFVELRKNYGDLTLIMQAIRRDLGILRARTGSRLGSDISPLVIIEPNRNGRTRSGVDYYGQVERRMQARLEYIVRHTRIEIIDNKIENVDLDSIESQLIEHLDELN